MNTLRPTEVIKRAVAIFLNDLWNCKIAIIAVILYLVVCNLIFHEVCPSVILLGIRCPGCGLTRGCISILTFQFAKAIKYNAASFLWVAFISYLVIARYFLAKQRISWILPCIVTCLSTIVLFVVTSLSFS